MKVYSEDLRSRALQADDNTEGAQKKLAQRVHGVLSRMGVVLLCVAVFVLFGACTERVLRACLGDEDCRGSAPALYCLEGRCQTAGCRAGETEPCYEGEPKTRDVGICRVGRRICQVGGVWSVCLEQVLPQTEICDRQDNDCNGQIDEVEGGCACFRPGASRPCYSGPEGSALRGLCQAGAQYCEEDNKWGPCNGEILPKAELCNGEDDDCDGKIDEVATCRCVSGQTRPCYGGPAATRGVGVCKEGIQRCDNGTWGICQGQILPSPEVCDGVDNNCDRRIDEECACEKDGDCADTQLCCGGACRSVGQDPRHCGRCEQVCSDGLRCVDGICACPVGLVRCDGRCVDLRVDALHCGECGRVCAGGGACVDGKCGVEVNPCGDKAQCGEFCVETQSDPLHCGRCFGRCLAGERCVGGRCTCEGSDCGACSQTCLISGQICLHGRCQCAAGWSLCSISGSARCLDLQKNPDHCGACGRACPSGSLCEAGQCVCPVSKVFLAGACVDRLSNVAHCGAAGGACPARMQSCNQGQCECPTGWGICNESPSPICRDFQRDRLHCGACDRACPVGSNCQEGRCSCPTGQQVCGAKCVDTMRDVGHCGACGRGCPGSQQVCVGGACRCPDGWWLCMESNKVLCADVQKDKFHCGACGRICPSGASCEGGRCVCAGGLVPCGDKCLASCGGTCSNCSATDAFCQEGACVCPPEKAVCIAAGRYACVDLKTDPRHCGVCSRMCEPNQKCIEGVCQCPEGKGICNGACTDFRIDAANCGTCGRACQYGQSCIDGECKCPKPQSICVASGAYLCVDLNQDIAHCGACNLVCMPGAQCTSGVCSCPSGKVLCAGACVDAMRDPAHCGGCRKACTTRGQICMDGVCSCPPYQSVCVLDGAYACLDLHQDPRGCGGCPSAKTLCSAQQTCIQGACASAP